MMYYTKNLAEKWRIRFFGKFWSFWLQFCYCHTSINKTIKNGFLSTIILFFVVILSWFVLFLVQPQNNRKRTRPIQYIQVVSSLFSMSTLRICEQFFQIVYYFTHFWHPYPLFSKTETITVLQLKSSFIKNTDFLLNFVTKQIWSIAKWTLSRLFGTQKLIKNDKTKLYFTMIDCYPSRLVRRKMTEIATLMTVKWMGCHCQFHDSLHVKIDKIYLDTKSTDQ